MPLVLVLLEHKLCIPVVFHLELEPLEDVQPAHLLVVQPLVLEPLLDLDEATQERNLLVLFWWGLGDP